MDALAWLILAPGLYLAAVTVCSAVQSHRRDDLGAHFDSAVAIGNAEGEL